MPKNTVKEVQIRIPRQVRGAQRCLTVQRKPEVAVAVLIVERAVVTGQDARPDVLLPVPLERIAGRLPGTSAYHRQRSATRPGYISASNGRS